MDSVKAFLVWPLVTTTAYTKFLLGFSFASVPALIHIIQHGTSSLSSFVDLFNFLKTIPFGLSFYSGLVCFYAPYTGSIHSRVVDFSSLHKCVIEMPDLPLLRNPFGSVHAAALTNLGEYATGLVMMEMFKRNKAYRGIPTALNVEFYTKARGAILATCCISANGISEAGEWQVVARLTDSKDELVAKCTVIWNIQPRVTK